MNLTARFGVVGVALREGSLEGLLAVADLDQHFAGDVLGSLAQHFGDLAHSLELSRFFDRLVAILRSRPALGIGRVLVGGFLGILSIGIRGAVLIALSIGLRLIRIGLLLVLAGLLGLLALVVRVALLAVLRRAVIGRLLAFRLELAQHVIERDAKLVHHS